MFKFIKKHAVAIALTVGALIAVALGCAHFLPTQTSAVLSATGGFFRGIGNTVAGWFGKGGAAVAEAGVAAAEAVEPVMAAAA